MTDADAAHGLGCGSELLKDVAFALQVAIHGVGKVLPNIAAIRARVAVPGVPIALKQDQLSGVAHRQGAQQRLVHQGKDGRIGADAQGQSAHDGGHKARSAAQLAE